MPKKLKYIITINLGSTSKKYALYKGSRLLAKAHFEHQSSHIKLSHYIEGEEFDEVLSQDDFENSLDYISGLWSYQYKDFGKPIIGLRVVSPGEYFTRHRLIDKNYINRLEKNKERAELHINPVLKELEQVHKFLPGSRIFGISDSAFHVTNTDVSRIYAIRGSDSRKYDIYRFGYHGLSAESVLGKMRKELKKLPKKTIVCHLGGGVSLTAVKSGKSLDNTMGFSPLEGLVMARRSGDIDPIAAVYLAQKKGLNFKKLEHYLNSESGLLGLSGKSSDIRDLLKLEKKGDKEAKLALESFVYRLVMGIGAYAALLDGIDAVIFTASIGERSWVMRDRICEKLGYLGIELDRKKNSQEAEGFTRISAPKSTVQVLVINTDEMEIIMNKVKKYISI